MTDNEKPAEPEAKKDRGKITLTFNEDDTLSVSYSDMKPWKFWAGGKMLETLGDQMMLQAQMEQMQAQAAQQQLAQALANRPGGLRGPATRG